MFIHYKDETFDGLKLKVDSVYWSSTDERSKYYHNLEDVDNNKLCETLKKESKDILHVKTSYSLIFGGFTLLFLALSVIFTVMCSGCFLGIGFLLYSLVMFLAHRCYIKHAKRSYIVSKKCEVFQKDI